MPLEGLDEEGLPRNPDLSLVQLKFLLSVGDDLGVDRVKVWEQLLAAIKENCKLEPSTSHTHTRTHAHTHTHTHTHTHLNR